MPQSATILQELTELQSSLATPHAGVPAYAVPNGYFESLAANILQRVKAEDADTAGKELEHLSPLLAGINRKNPYSVPAGYFEDLDPSFAFADDQDSQAELQKISPLLSSLPKTSPFSIPGGYFEQQTGVPGEKQSEPAPVVRMAPAPRNWYRFAAAASVLVIVTLGISLWLKKPGTSPSDIQSYAWVEKNLKKVSTEDISKFVELAEPASNDMAVVGGPGDIKTLLKNVSDKEIQDFLKDVPVDETEDEDILFN